MMTGLLCTPKSFNDADPLEMLPIEGLSCSINNVAEHCVPPQQCFTNLLIWPFLFFFLLFLKKNKNIKVHVKIPGTCWMFLPPDYPAIFRSYAVKYHSLVTVDGFILFFDIRHHCLRHFKSTRPKNRGATNRVKIRIRAAWAWEKYEPPYSFLVIETIEQIFVQ